MKPIQFKGSNVIYGANQPEYQPLPALKIDDNEGAVITCWELSDDEIKTIAKNGRIYFKQLTFNNSLQPILPIADLGDDLMLNL